MNPERWQEVKRLFDAVLERDPAERTRRFWKASCGDDADLRRRSDRAAARSGRCRRPLRNSAGGRRSPPQSPGRPLSHPAAYRHRRHGRSVSRGARRRPVSTPRGRQGHPRGTARRTHPPPLRKRASHPGRTRPSQHCQIARWRNHRRRHSLPRDGLCGGAAHRPLLQGTRALYGRAAGSVSAAVRRGPICAPESGGPPRSEACQRAGDA